MNGQFFELNKVVASPYGNEVRLLADIGGTNARFALELSFGVIDHICVLACADYPDLEAAVRAYLQKVGLPTVQHAALAIANPVVGDLVQMTNHHWCFSIEQTRQGLGLKTLLLANDFTALAMSLPYLSECQRELIEGESNRMRISAAPASRLSLPRPIALVGAGTGLGVSGLVPAGDTWVALNSEGGHRSFAPSDDIEAQILSWMWQHFSHVSTERLVSGPGIAYLYRALAAARNQLVQDLTPPEVVREARRGEALALETLRLFSAMLGSVAGDVALTLGSLGGLYIGGGVVKQLGELFDRTVFRERFLAKGRFRNYLEQIPTYLITAEYPAFLGTSAMLAAQLPWQH